MNLASLQELEESYAVFYFGFGLETDIVCGLGFSFSCSALNMLDLPV